MALRGGFYPFRSARTGPIRPRPFRRSGRRTERPGESLFKLRTARAFHRLSVGLTDFSIPLDAGDFRGVPGEHPGRIYAEVKRRPLYFVTERSGFVTGDRTASETSAPRS